MENINMEKLFKKCVFEASLENSYEPINTYIELTENLAKLGIDEPYEKLNKLAKDALNDVVICNDCKDIKLDLNKKLYLSLDYKFDNYYESHTLDIQLTYADNIEYDESSTINMYISSDDKLKYVLFRHITLYTLRAYIVKSLVNNIIEKCNIEGCKDLIISINDVTDDIDYNTLMAMFDDAIFSPQYW